MLNRWRLPIWIVAGGASLLLIAVVAMKLEVLRDAFAAPRSDLSLKDIPFNGQRAYEYLKEICELGPRVSGTAEMAKQQEMLTKHFESLGGRVSRQEFPYPHPETRERIVLTNLIVEWHPERKQRVLLCAHYDTRPFPDEEEDPRKKKAVFLGANDGASGVSVLMELGEHMPDFKSDYGVDFVFFDAEELVYDRDRGDPYFVGSEHFAREYVQRPPAHRYRMGVLLDMVGDAELQIYQERNSLYLKDVRPITTQIWNVARKLGVHEFIARPRHEIRDDHLALNNIAKIPTCDIIDFDYPRPGAPSYWHTTKDVPENCSALSLAKVGWVVHEWLKSLK